MYMHEKTPSKPEQPDVAEQKKLLLGVPSPLETDGKDKVFASVDEGVESSILAWMNGRGTGGSNVDDVENLLKACPTPFELKPLEEALLNGVKKQKNDDAYKLCEDSLNSLKRKLYGRRLELYEEFEKDENGNGWNNMEEKEETPEIPEDPEAALEAIVALKKTPEKPVEKPKNPFLNLVETPLDNPTKLDEIIDAYAKPVGQFYNNLQYAHKAEKEASPENKDDHDYFNKLMFMRWKKSYLELKDDDASNEQKFIKGFLESCPDAKSIYELKDIAKKSYSAEDYGKIEKVFDDNNWEHEENGWTHILSERSKANAAKAAETKHRLYLNIDNGDIYKMAALLVTAFDIENMPFYFKFDNDGGKRDDTIVIYCAEEDLEKTHFLLKRIEKGNSDIISRAGEPVLLAGKVDGWIGYGAHPEKIPGEKKSSYSEIRAKLLEEALDASADEWKETKESDPTYLIDIKEEAAKNVVKGRKEIYDIWQNKGRTDDEIRAAIGYGESDLTDESYKRAPVTDKDIKKAICDEARHDEKFIAIVKKNVRKLSPKYHIDPDNFCANS